MIFINDAKIYAKVWHVDRKEKYTDVRISTSEKDADGNYVNSTWFPRLIGHAHQKLKDLKEGDKIIISKAKFTNEGYTDKEGNKKSAFKFLILEAEPESQNENTTKPSAKSEPKSEEANTEEDPW